MSTVAAPIRTTPARLRERALPAYVGACVMGALVAAVFGWTGAITDEPLVFAALALAMVAIEFVDSENGGGHTSPSTVPAIVIAMHFGPAGIVVAEAMVTGRRLLRGGPLIKPLFDFGLLALAGVGAWAAAQPLPDHGGLLLVAGLAAGLAYVAVNHALITTVWVLDEARSPIALFRDRLLPGVPHEVACGPLAALFLVAAQQMGALSLAVVGVPTAALWLGQAQSLRAERRRITELEDANGRLRKMMISTVESLARTIEARDPYTGGHTERVAEFAHKIADQLGFDDEGLRALAAGAVIHDIGKLGIPDSVLLKPGSLDEEEWATMRRHPEIGSYILDDLDLPEITKAMARHHHERYDGKGYPDGLSGEVIPLAARILTVADALDAMTSDRPYRKALPIDVALQELREKSGTQFCPRVVAAALDVIR